MIATTSILFSVSRLLREQYNKHSECKVPLGRSPPCIVLRHTYRPLRAVKPSNISTGSMSSSLNWRRLGGSAGRWSVGEKRADGEDDLGHYLLDVCVAAIKQVA